MSCCGQPTDDSADLPLRGAGYRSENFALAEDFLARSYFDAPGCILLDLLNVGSAQIDVKISFKGRGPTQQKRAPQAALPLRFPGHGPAYEKERHYVTRSVDEVVWIKRYECVKQNSLLKQVSKPSIAKIVGVGLPPFPLYQDKATSINFTAVQAWALNRPVDDTP